MSVNYTNVVFLDVPEVGEPVLYRLYGKPTVITSKILTKVEPTVTGYRAMEQGGVILAGSVDPPAHQIPAQPPAHKPPAGQGQWYQLDVTSIPSYPGMRFFVIMFIASGIIALIVALFYLFGGTEKPGLALGPALSSVGFFITGQVLGWMVNVADDIKEIRTKLK